jgi:cell division protein FtsW
MAQPTAAVKPRERSRPRINLGLDPWLLVTVACLLTVGLVMVYSSSYNFALMNGQAPLEIFQHQVIFILLGIVVAIGVSFFDYHWLKPLAVPAVLLAMVLLVLVLVIGETYNGATRTLFGGSVQPSELAKAVLVIYLAVWLNAKRDQLHDFSYGLLPLGIILGILGALIFLQPDYSAAITIFLLGGAMFVLASSPIKQVIAILMLAAVAGIGLYWLATSVLPPDNTLVARITEFRQGWADPEQASYQERYAMAAFVNGKWFGVGVGNGRLKLAGLPFPQTDSIFAVIGEEFGVLGCAVVLGLFMLLLWRGLSIAARASDELGGLLAAGLTIWLALEAFINMAVIVHLMPFAGNALPFISAGGSIMVTTMGAVGIIFNVARQSDPQATGIERNFRAVVDLRRRHGGRGVSRSSRPTSSAK